MRVSIYIRVATYLPLNCHGLLCDSMNVPYKNPFYSQQVLLGIFKTEQTNRYKNVPEQPNTIGSAINRGGFAVQF